eukprot:TRINITY_DN3455_c0_g5_i1.p1 TRINITY_DN3455_c0_g5~~TRINITY_DN3455_c0_g5_i1.p1  ORF type:complete len:305 (+),score=92.55 TRINITY_DN3455_c0_g5_i1:142-1056(+)
MSWYVGLDGRQVWVDRSETAYTCDKPDEEEKPLPIQNLTYLASGSSKAVYQEHAIDDDDGSKGKKKERQSGRQRGFVVRVDQQDDRPRINGPFQAAVDKLYRDGVVSRVDPDESEKENKRGKKKRGKAQANELNKKEEPEEEEAEAAKVEALPLGLNECRVDIISRCSHMGHGGGFILEISEIGERKRYFVYTNGKELPTAAMHSCIVQALAADGSKVMLGRLNPAMAPDPPDEAEGRDGSAAKSKKADAEEDDWLASVMGRCMVDKEKEKEKEKPKESTGGYAEAEAKPKAPVKLPPWLQGRR